MKYLFNILPLLSKPLLLLLEDFGHTRNLDGKNNITLKASLMQYQEQLQWSIEQYKKDNNIEEYKYRLVHMYNQLIEKIHLSYYIPKELRNKIFTAIWFPLKVDKKQNIKDLELNWEKFNKNLKSIFKKFESLIIL